MYLKTSLFYAIFTMNLLTYHQVINKLMNKFYFVLLMNHFCPIILLELSYFENLYVMTTTNFR